jgi:hypothetical protein
MKKMVAVLLLCIGNLVHAQIPVETFVGNEKTTLDIMFFKFFKKRQDENSRWLFFNRNRASIDYRMTESAYVPQFGFTEAISYNHARLKGLAPVFVAQVLSGGVYPKAGIQYVHLKKEITLFTWLVCETLKDPNVDYFLLVRYTPKLNERLNLFTQLESLNSFPTVVNEQFTFIQRLRLGIKVMSYQFGVGADFNQYGNRTFEHTYNMGGFIRHEF